MKQTAVLRHCVQEIELPYRQVTEAEVAEAREGAAKYADIPAQRWNFRWHQAVVERYEAQQAGTEGTFKMELDALRLGDVAVALPRSGEALVAPRDARGRRGRNEPLSSSTRARYTLGRNAELGPLPRTS